MNRVKSTPLESGLPKRMPLGPVMLDVADLSLDDAERKRLLHPSVGAVILFARNYQSPEQVADLIAQIKSLRTPQLLIAVDQEGGRVQRFQDGFTRLPPASEFGELWQKDKQSAPMRAFESAYVMASELIKVGVDFSFAPVFDVTSKDSEVIGNRCFHSDPQVASELLGAYIDGMHSAGMVAIAKHFPGHGGVSGDSHDCLPQDARDIIDVRAHDLIPYQTLVDEIQGVMTAHVLFEQCADDIPTYSHFWLQSILRDELQFSGVVFSDDLTMQGAKDAIDTQDSIVVSAQRAIYAGCDMVLVCNSPDIAEQLLSGLEFDPNETLSAKLSRLTARPKR